MTQFEIEWKEISCRLTGYCYVDLKGQLNMGERKSE